MGQIVAYLSSTCANAGPGWTLPQGVLAPGHRDFVEVLDLSAGASSGHDGMRFIVNRLSVPGERVLTGSNGRVTHLLQQFRFVRGANQHRAASGERRQSAQCRRWAIARLVAYQLLRLGFEPDGFPKVGCALVSVKGGLTHNVHE